MCTASFEKGYCYRTYATKTQTDAALAPKVGNNRLFANMRFPLPFTYNQQREIKEEEKNEAATTAAVVVRNIDDMRQQLQVPSSEWGAPVQAMTTNRVGGMRRVRSANASRPRRGGGGGGGGGDA